MNSLCGGALSFLENVYSEELALFPYTTRLSGEQYHRDFDHPMAIRSTINSLLGLQEMSRQWPDHPFLRLTDRNTTRFLQRHESRVVLPADLGLLLLLLVGSEIDPRVANRVLGRAQEVVNDERRCRQMNVQDVCWLLWGSVAAARIGMVDADIAAHLLFTLLTDKFVSPGAVLPSQSVRPGRFGVVSFGACAYFLRALHEYGKWSDSSSAMTRFRRGVRALLTAQGPTGEWPWLLSNRDGRPLDYYPVFSVHQNSMSMLFLFPALDSGIAEAEPAIASSMNWMYGKNQLGVSLIQQDPFYIWRSFERKATLPRPERFVRALRVYATGGTAVLAPNDQLVINRESRSYELGWILYTQSRNPHAPGVSGTN
jgi:hypothetical protein